MDVFVLPSRSEGFSLALLEGLTAGLPVISTRVGIAPDVVEDGANGLLVERDDVHALADAMMRVAVDDVFRERLRTGAAKPLSGIPGMDEHARALLELYESLLSRSRAHAARAD
jgi:glycosyltransferase involved in cell wall biosynthesis